MIVVIYKVHINTKNRICNFSNSLIESEKLKAEKFLIGEKNYKDLVVYFTNYVNSKSIKSLYYHKLMGKIEEHEGEIMVDY